MQFVKIYLVVMNVNVHQNSMEIPSQNVLNAILWNANVNHLINSLMETVCYQDVLKERNVHRGLNVLPFQEELAIALVPKDIARNQMDLALMLTNVLRTDKFVVTVLNVSTNLEVMNAIAQEVTVEILIMDFVHQLKNDVLVTKNVLRTRNVSNPENVSVHHHSLPIHSTIINVKVLVNDILAASMLNVLQVILLSACVKQVIRVIHSTDALILMNAQIHHVLMELTV